MRTQSHQVACDTKNYDAYAPSVLKIFSFTNCSLLPHSSAILSQNVLTLLVICCYDQPHEKNCPVSTTTGKKTQQQAANRASRVVGEAVSESRTQAFGRERGTERFQRHCEPA